MATRNPAPEPGTALTAEQQKVADREKRREALMGSLPEAVKHQLALRQMTNAVAAEIAGMSWGANIGKDTARMLAEWGRRYGVDVTQEIDILGNKVYLNARFYLRRLAEFIDSGLVEYAYADHINEDSRLEKLGEDGATEATRRLGERIRYNVPEKAVSVVAFRVKLRALEQETVGVNWAGGGVRKSDPVGDAEPVKTAESRAARRCMRQLVSHVPTMTAEMETVVSTLPELEARIQSDHDSVKPAPFARIADGGYGDAPVVGTAEPSVSAQEAVAAEEEGRLL